MTSLAKKKRNNIIIMVVLVLILAVTFVAVTLTNKDDEIETTEISYPITNLKSGQIAAVSYTYKDGSYASYKYADSEWYNADDSNFPLSTSGFENQFVTTFLGLTSSRKLTEYEGGIEALGLDEPELTLTITGNDNKTVTYKVGNYNPTIGQYYLMIDDDKDNIYMVTDDLLYICRKDMYDYATVDTFPAYSLETLDYMQFTSGDITSTLIYREEGLEEDITGYGWQWFFDKPFSHAMPCESSKMQTMTEDVLPLCEYTKTVNYNASEEELKEYGLDNPRGSYSIYFNETDEDGNIVDCSVTVYIGNKSETESGYYTREIKRMGLTQVASTTVRILSVEGADVILGVNPLEYILTNVLFLEIEDIDGSTIKFNTGNGEYTFGYSDGESNETMTDDIYTMGDKVIDGAGFKQVWQQMVAIKPERIISDKTTIKTDEPAYTIFADRIDDDDYYGDITVKFVKYDSNYYQVEINGATDMLMRTRDVDALFKSIDEFAESCK